jgi:hypothetical protein
VRFEAYTLDHLYRTADHAEAVVAFREKRRACLQRQVSPL